MSDLVARLKTAALMVVLLFGLFFFLPASYLFLFAIFAWAVAQYELLSAFNYPVWLMPIIFIILSVMNIAPFIILAGVLAVICLIILLCFQAKPSICIPKQLLFLLTSCLLFAALVTSVKIYTDFGLQYFIALWLMVAMVDASGYFVGKNFGRNKMITNVSPQKTWEGFLGALAIILITIPYYYQYISYVNVMLAILIVVSAVVGDLWFSYCKRSLNLKDYSQMLPGHGGVLDRLDGLVFALPVVFIFFKIFAKQLVVS